MEITKLVPIYSKIKNLMEKFRSYQKIEESAFDLKFRKGFI